MMKKVINNGTRVPIKMWLDHLEEGAVEQAKNLANLPFTFRHVAIMPDSHTGYGMPIGAVLASQGSVVPNAVGVDIGCGMCAVRFDMTQQPTKKQLEKVVEFVRKHVPVGFNSQPAKQDASLVPDMDEYNGIDMVRSSYEYGLWQVGTLGGGNHFIEIQRGSDGHVWAMIHSGSRKLGSEVAKYHNMMAVDMNAKWHSGVPKDLAFFPIDSPEGQTYIADQKYCVDFAEANRKAMMNWVVAAMEKFCKAEQQQYINKPHNFADMENHFHKNVLVHRKGATRARKGELGMIPGSMGTKSYIVRGLGNSESFDSCSHGAGRKLSRNKARKSLNLQREMKKMKGVVHGMTSKEHLDEAPGAYKNIDEVMANQTDLVKIEVELTPLAVIKG